MKIWSSAFKIWKDACPHIRRELISKNGFIQWADDLKLLGSFEKDDFFAFMSILEDCEIICPLAFGQASQGVIYSSEYLLEKPLKNKLTPYYHPIQFFEIINWFRHKSLRRSPYHSSQNFREFFSFKVIERKTNKLRLEKESLKRHEPEFTELIGRMEESLIKLQKELANHPLNDWNHPSGLELLKHLKIAVTRNILSEKSLSLWIKVESLLLQEDAHIYAPDPPRMRINLDFHHYYENSEKLQQKIKIYNEWRKSVIDNKENFLDKDELVILKNFHRELNRKISDGDYGPFGNSGNWSDLFDVIPAVKKDKLLGMTSYFINLLSMKRYLERIIWELFEINITTKHESNKKPYFVFNNPEDFDEYMESVLLQFSLIKNNPFVLFVEGATEETIVREYLQNSDSPKFRIESTQGISNIQYYLRISKAIKDWYTYSFLDYDTFESYQKNKTIVESMNIMNSFFFPDFVTENFTVTQFMNSLLNWLSGIDIFIDQSLRSEIEKRLIIEKEYSNIIIQNIEKGNEIITNGFEKYSFNQIKKHYSKEIAEVYPQISLDHNNFILNTKEFDEIFKTEIADRLKIYIYESIKGDPERKSKFPFEKKIAPFQEKILSMVYHIPHYLS